MTSTIVPIAPHRTAEVVDVLCDAFRDYPVMRYVLEGSSVVSPDPERLRTLIRFFVMARVLRGEPVLGIEAGAAHALGFDPHQGTASAAEPLAAEALVAVATLTLPESGPAPQALDEERDRTWSGLGDDARRRYEELGLIWLGFGRARPHYHLNMIGVRRDYAGQGLGRTLLAEVHLRSTEDPRSSGVSLTTEDPRNVELYRHLGYDVVAEGEVPGALKTWGLFREG